MEPIREKKNYARPNRYIGGGLFLILLGGALLLEHWLDIGNYLVLLIGLGLLLWGSLARRTGLLIPGGVLTGIGLGILASSGPWHLPASGQNGLFLLCFAFGWFSITLLSALFTRIQWWALIPGGIMGLVGAAILLMDGGLGWLDLNLVFAALLIIIGVTLLIIWGRPKKNN